ncbi:hypothetical protein [Mycobacterium avium]|uniref:hypothetical protein n=1 Tax=Mycobacterium avium TaxID=1764 RepID=UPI0011555DA0|nr:hypothetical protein [Mycobacterium avium]
MVVVVTVRDLAGHLGASGEDDAGLWGPFVRYRTVNDSDSDCLMDWRADVVMWTAAGDEVLVGFVDFLTVQSDSRDGDEMFYLLDSVSESAAAFAPFFRGAWLDPDVEETLGAGAVEYVVLVTYVFIESAVRGSRLGAWAITELAHRMMPAHTGLLLMLASMPVPAEAEPSEFERKRAARLVQYWCSAGLNPVEGYPGFLSAAAAFTQLPDAREGFSDVRDLRKAVTVADLADGEIDSGSLDIE